MNEIKIFENPAFGKIRTAGTSEGPLFCLADICKAVELTNPSSVKGRLDVGDVQLIDLHALNGENADMVGNTIATFINESAFYDVLLFSSSVKVKPFRKWITHDVLPSIRKTGSYNMPNFSNPAEAARAWADQYERNLALETKNQELKPKADYFDCLVDRKLNINFRDTAKEIGLKQNDFIKRLVEAKYIYRDAKGQLKPYAAYVDTLFIIKECKSGEKWAGNQTLVTPRGRETFNLMFGEQNV